MDKVTGIVFHHTATKGATINSMAEFHIQHRGWHGIAYHYAVGWDGTIFHLNSVDRLTWHTEGHNTANIGVALVGNMQVNEMPFAQREAAINLTYYLRERYGTKRVTYHRMYKATACPGENAIRTLNPIWRD